MNQNSIKHELVKGSPGNSERPFKSTWTNIRNGVRYVQMQYPSGKLWVEDNGGEAGGPGSSATFCNLILEPAPVELGPVQPFEVLGVPTQGDPPTGDAELIPGEISFRRLTDGGAIFNAALGETFWDNTISPLDTEWNSCYVGAECGFGDLSDVHTRTFGTLIEAVDYGFGGNIVGLEMVMRQKSTGRLFAITFTSWASGGGPGPYGGFAFNAQEIFADQCRITFPDGTILTTAAGGNTDQALMPGVAFVSPTGNDQEAVVGDQNKPFFNPINALSESDMVIILPGSYFTNINILSTGWNKTVYAMPGVIFTGGRINVTGASAVLNFLGSAVFTGAHNGLFVTGVNSKVNFEFDRMDNTATVMEVFSNAQVNVVCNSILCSGLNGFGGGATVRDSSNVKMNIANFYHCQHRLVFFRAGTTSFSGKFEITCPDMRILANYQASYGNAAKAVFEMDRTDGAEFIFNGNMTVDHNALGSGQRGCIAIVNQLAAPSKVTINGDLNGGPFNPGLYTGFQAYVGNVVMNGSVNADIQPPLQLLRSGGLATGKNFYMTFNGSVITGSAECQIQDGKEIYFRDCSFYNSSAEEGEYNIIYSASSGDASELYFYNCIAELAGVGDFINGGAAIGILGCHNVVSADPLGAGAVDTFAGYTVIAGIKVPKF